MCNIKICGCDNIRSLPRLTLFLLLCVAAGLTAVTNTGNCQTSQPLRQEVITPLRNDSFNKNGQCRERKLGGNPRTVNSLLIFDGANDGNRQVDPQIAVGGNHVLHATNSGLIIYKKSGEFVQGVSQRCFNGGIDPKLFYDRHNGVFGFDLWNPWDKEKKKPVNISVSESSDPTAAWNTYPIPAPEGRDGGAIGYSRKWIGYSFPGGEARTFILKTKEVKSGKPATVYHFKGGLGHPVATQDAIDDLYFVKLEKQTITVNKVAELNDGTPVTSQLFSVPHNFKYFGWPPQSPQKGTEAKTASGDRNPKNLVVQSGFLWFSQTINCDGRAAVQWHQIDLKDGTFVQSGLINHPINSYIQTTLAVNKRLDVLVGFQEAGPEMFISPRMVYRRASDPLGKMRPVLSLGEGQAATEGGAWGDYSGSVVDGDNMLDLWTIQSIADSTGRGDTVIARLSHDVNPSNQAQTKTTSSNNTSQSIKASQPDKTSQSIKATRIHKVGDDFPRQYRRAFDRYVQVIAPQGKPIHIFAQPEISAAQIRHVRDVMIHYLTDLPGSEFGNSKAAIADRMADNRAMMMICKGHDGQYREPRIFAQPLYADETIVEGSPAYINNEFEDHRDATLEETLHCVHDFGIGVDVRGAPKGAAADFQKEIRAATTAAMKNNIWPTKNADAEASDWIEELRQEGSLTQEYLASVIDSYYGLWGPFDEDFGMWGIYIARTRADIKLKDLKGYSLVQKFFHPFLTYNAEIDSSFDGTFLMTFDPKTPYTHKSRYLLNARLTGEKNSNLTGNAEDNTLSGNSGENVIDGGNGHDTVVFAKPESTYTVIKNDDGSTTVVGEGTDRLLNIEKIIFDGTKLESKMFVAPIPHNLAGR